MLTGKSRKGDGSKELGSSSRAGFEPPGTVFDWWSLMYWVWKRKCTKKPWDLWAVYESSLELVPQPFLAPGPICPACSSQKGYAELVIGNGFRGMILSANRKNTGPAAHNH